MSARRGKGTVAIVGGAGAVGSSAAFALMDSGLVGEIVLVDIDDGRAEGEAMDLAHGAYFTSPVTVRTGGYEDCWDADVVIVTAGASQAPDETRLDLVERNADIFAEMVPEITAGLRDDAVLLVVTNPVDVLSYVAWQVSDLPAERVIGSGTVLDTARFRHALSREFDLDPANVHAYVIGEHGDSEVLVWDSVNLGGIPLESYCAQRGIEDTDLLETRISAEVRDAAYEIIERKGRTNYGVARSVTATVERILGDGDSILTVSTLLDGQYGIDDVYLSLPCTVNRAGVRDVLEFDLSDGEQRALEDSAAVVRESIDRLNVD
ncbi:L-lactate dehydrogenase [Halobellus marinus]|uniref:L-lactate dehydrogenase n=1 Tax=Halobellus TaxID=1073986 RepID=UPI0028AB3AD7|nr:L-lactate dehydrogenase [Halobellus sp. DFY28]